MTGYIIIILLILLIYEKLKNKRMCEKCGQPDWYCQDGKKKSSNTESTGYGTLTLDFEKRSIVIQFPENWDEMTNEEQYLWIKKHIQP